MRFVLTRSGNAGRSLLKSARERLLMRLLFDNGCSSLVSEAAQGPQHNTVAIAANWPWTKFRSLHIGLSSNRVT